MALFSMLSIMKSSYRHPRCHSWLFTKMKSKHFLHVRHPGKAEWQRPTCDPHLALEDCHLWFGLVKPSGVWERIMHLASGKWRMEGGFQWKKTQGEKWLFLRNYHYGKPWRFHELLLGKIYCQGDDSLDVWLPYFRTHLLSCLLVWINQLCLQILIEQPKDVDPGLC